MHRAWRPAAVGVAITLAVAGTCAQGTRSACADRRSSSACVRVLFIGNSYTSVNNLPVAFTTIANAVGRAVQTDMIAPGGATLADHARNAETLALIRGGQWRYVVLQEQSLMPATTASREGTMYPAARALVAEIRRAGAEPILYQTWGRKAGWPDGNIADFSAMQDSLTAGYAHIARELEVRVVPVGEAWRLVRAEHPEVALWQADGSHPSVQGTFLAASAFVAVLLRETPRGQGDGGAIPAAQVAVLHQAAVRASAVK